MLRCRSLTLTLVSADNLPNVRKNGVMKVYAKVSLNGKSNSKKRSPTDRRGETNPRWNFTVDYTVNESAVRSEAGLEVVVKLYCERMMGDRFIGQVRIAVNSLFVNKSSTDSVNEVNYSVYGTSKGRLKILYGFGAMFLVPKPSNWTQSLTRGVLVQLLVHGVWFLFTGDFISGAWVHLIGN